MVAAVSSDGYHLEVFVSDDITTGRLAKSRLLRRIWALLRVWLIPKSSSALQSSMGPHVMAFGVTNLGLVLVPYPPNSEKGQNMILEGMILCGAILPRLWRPFEPLHGAAANALARCKSGLSMPALAAWKMLSVVVISVARCRHS